MLSYFNAWYAVLSSNIYVCCDAKKKVIIMVIAINT